MLSTYMKLFSRNNGPKALKILTDDVTLLQGKDAFELEVLEQVASAQETLGNKRLLQLQDHFKVPGEHGEHLCFVTDPLGISLLDVQSAFESKRLPLQLVKNVTGQLLEGLQVLHEQCKVVHTGNVPQ
jgi:serine/threonine-protein kinase SRPK3